MKAPFCAAPRARSLPALLEDGSLSVHLSVPHRTDQTNRRDFVIPPCSDQSPVAAGLSDVGKERNACPLVGTVVLAPVTEIPRIPGALEASCT